VRFQRLWIDVFPEFQHLPFAIADDKEKDQEQEHDDWQEDG
jgi:hypothetical protein